MPRATIGFARRALLPFGLDLLVDLILVIEVVRHGGVGFGRAQVGMLPAHLLRRPAVSQVIHDDLGHADAGMLLEARRLAGGLLDDEQ